MRPMLLKGGANFKQRERNSETQETESVEDKNAYNKVAGVINYWCTEY